MSQTTTPPIETPDPHYAGDTETTRIRHPAYAMIGASRITTSHGGSVLFGSDFKHSASVRITLCEASVMHSLARDTPLGGRELFCVELSEAQWARFVSAMNIGDGAQCTLQHVNQVPVPQIPAPVDRRSQFAADSASRSKLVLDSIREAREALAATGLSAKKQKEIMDKLHTAEMNADANQGYVAEQFSRHMEKTVQAAAIEINAMVTNVVHQVGLDTLKGRGIHGPVLTMVEPSQPVIDNQTPGETS